MNIFQEAVTDSADLVVPGTVASNQGDMDITVKNVGIVTVYYNTSSSPNPTSAYPLDAGKEVKLELTRDGPVGGNQLAFRTDAGQSSRIAVRVVYK